MRFLTLILALLVFMPAFGQKTKKKEDGVVEAVFAEGVVYALPRTGVRVVVKTTCTDFAPGPYARFAEQLLGITNVKTQASSEWQINGIEFESFSEPDPLNVYKAMGEAAALVSTSSNGCLAGINTKGLETVGESQVTNPVSYSKKSFSPVFDNLSDVPFYSVGDSTNGFRSAKLSAEQKAAQAASRILSSRKARFEISAGLLDEFHPDGGAYQSSLIELARIENDFLKLFIGDSRRQELVFSFEFFPSEKNTKGEVLFRFSDEKGVLDKSDLAGKPVMIEVETVADLNNGFSRLVKSDNPNAGESGVYYRMPGMGNIKLVYELQALATSRIPVAQFGAVAPVPEIYLDGNFILEFHPETGAVKNIIKK